MPNLADESYEEYLSIEDGFEIAGCPTNAEICEEVMQSRKEGGEDDTAENRPQKTQKTRRRHRKNKEVVAWLDAMRRQFQFQGMNMDLYFKLKKCMLDNMFKRIKETTTESYFKSK